MPTSITTPTISGIEGLRNRIVFGEDYPSIEEMAGAVRGAVRPHTVKIEDAPVAVVPERLRGVPGELYDEPRRQAANKQGYVYDPDGGGVYQPEYDPTQQSARGIDQKEFERTRRDATRSMGEFPASELMAQAIALRTATEGYRANPYNDAGGIAIGLGLNLTVQDEKSLRNFVGDNDALYNKLKPGLGKKWGELSPEQLQAMALTEEEAAYLNPRLIDVSHEATASYHNSFSPLGVITIGDLQHWTGSGGLVGHTPKLGVTVNGQKRNFVAEVITRGDATDEDLLDALVKTHRYTTNGTTKARLKKYIDRFKG